MATTPIPTTGTKFFVRNIAGADIEVVSHTSIDGLDGERNEHDDSTLLDEAEVIALGIKRYGTVTLGVLHSETDLGLAEIEASYNDGIKRTYSWVFSTGTYRQFTAFAKNFPFENGGLDARYKANLKLRVSGDVTKATGFVAAP
jgi:hypothetical protein